MVLASPPLCIFAHKKGKTWYSSTIVILNMMTNDGENDNEVSWPFRGVLLLLGWVFVSFWLQTRHLSDYFICRLQLPCDNVFFFRSSITSGWDFWGKTFSIKTGIFILVNLLQWCFMTRVANCCMTTIFLLSYNYLFTYFLWLFMGFFFR